MTAWRLELRRPVRGRVDASPIGLDRFGGRSVVDVCRLTLHVDGVPVEVGDMFTVARSDRDFLSLVVAGDLKRFDRIAAEHSRGEFRVVGSVGSHAADGMCGGQLIVEGDAGKFLGGPAGAKRVGMRGGRVVIEGSTGGYAGHRMRRGELLIEGDSGPFLACHQVAGTIIVAGNAGESSAYGMRRGTLVLNRQPEWPPNRFSEPAEVGSVFPELLRRGLSRPCGRIAGCRDLVDRLARGPTVSVRGDFAVSGQGEILTPQG